MDIKKNSLAKLTATHFVPETMLTYSGKASHVTVASATGGSCLVWSYRYHRIHKRKSHGNIEMTFIPVLQDGASSWFDSGNVTLVFIIILIKERCQVGVHIKSLAPGPFFHSSTIWSMPQKCHLREWEEGVLARQLSIDHYQGLSPKLQYSALPDFSYMRHKLSPYDEYDAAKLTYNENNICTS